jgi:hypothetical protein
MMAMHLMHLVQHFPSVVPIGYFNALTGKQVHKCIRCILPYAGARICARNRLSGIAAQSALSAFERRTQFHQPYQDWLAGPPWTFPKRVIRAAPDWYTANSQNCELSRLRRDPASLADLEIGAPSPCDGSSLALLPAGTKRRGYALGLRLANKATFRVTT